MSRMKQKALSGPPSQETLEGGPNSAPPFFSDTVAALLRMDLGDSQRPAVQGADRPITDRANIIETGTESYRFRRTLDKRKGKATETKT